LLRKKYLAAPSSERTSAVGGHVHIQDSILQRIFRRVQLSRAEGTVLDAILSKANLYGKHAKVAYPLLSPDHRVFRAACHTLG